MNSVKLSELFQQRHFFIGKKKLREDLLFNHHCWKKECELLAPENLANFHFSGLSLL